MLVLSCHGDDEMAHTTLKVQVVIALFRHANDQLPPLCRDSLSSNVLSQPRIRQRRSSPPDYTILGHPLPCSHVVLMK
jgi:hypothetical protein